jgi:hypothetical protein
MYTGCNDGSGDHDHEFVIVIPRPKIILQDAIDAPHESLREAIQAAQLVGNCGALAAPWQQRALTAKVS